MTCKLDGLITNTTPGRADAGSGARMQHPIASQTPPEVAVLHAAAEADLESRIKERRAEHAAFRCFDHRCSPDMV
jgi:hypothetical protein